MNCIFPVHSFNDVLAWCKRTGLCHYMHPSYLLLIRYKEDNVLHTLAFEVQVTSSYLKLSQVFGGGGGAKSIHWKFFFQLYGNDSLYL